MRQLHENLQLLPRQHLRPPAEDSDIEGHAAVGELLVRLDGPPRSRLPLGWTSGKSNLGRAEADNPKQHEGSFPPRKGNL